MSFRRRSYPEIMDNMLTRLIGGVAAESHAFPPPGQKQPPFTTALEQQPVGEVSSVYGLRNGESRAFVRDTDFVLAGNGQAIEWLEGGALPDAGSTFEINYTLKGATPAANDLHIGSVLRTLAESASHEMAALYAQMESVYRAGFIDTANGKALDNVVALLGIRRVRAGRNIAKLRFSRAKGSLGDIVIPAGTRVLTEDGGIEYATITDLTMLNGQSVAITSARDLVETNDGITAGALALLAIPIAGVDSVTNPEPSTTLDRDENDDELRERAKGFLHGSERGTLGAIRQVFARHQVLAEVSEDAPGIVNVSLHGNDIDEDQLARIRKAVDDVRPAGIKVVYAPVAPPQVVDVELRIATSTGLLATDLRRIQDAIRTQVTDYFATLPVKSAGSINRIIGAALSQPEVEDVRVLSAGVGATDVLDRESGLLAIEGAPTILGNLVITDPALPTQVMVKVSFPDDQPPANNTAINAALTAMFSHINEYNAREAPAVPTAVDIDRTQLGLGKFLLITPFPGHTAQTLPAYESALGTPEALALPGSATVAPYTVEVVITPETGLSHIIDDDATPAYVLSPFERLTLAGVDIVVVESAGA